MALDALWRQDGGAPGLTAGITLQRVLWDRPPALRPLYWRAALGATAPAPNGALRIEPGATVSFDTYFGALFERTWRLYTRAGPLGLSVQSRGQAALRVFRRVPGGPAVLLAEHEGDGPAHLLLPAETPHHRQAGLLWFELTAGNGGTTLERAEWTAPTLPGTSPARLAVVVCTFNRQAPLGAVLAALAGDAGLHAALARVIVVNQGTPGLRAHPDIVGPASALGGRLRVVEQANLGGAGGFGRGMLEALDDDDATHICLLDDDVRIEPESLRRIASFFTLLPEAAPLALGGHMLDGMADTVLYEAGARVRPDWSLQPLHHRLDLRAPGRLLRLLDTLPMHYNGWWMFAFDKRLIGRHGMPLPCFIRGDDVEFGLRLAAAGVPTVSLPGVAVWHEPFYLKIGGWQLYYETRNALIAAALHEPFPPGRAALQVTKRLLIHLLTYRYYNAALVVRAVQDFRAGPAILDRDPRPLHAGLATLRARWPDTATRREQVLPDAWVAGSPRSRLGFVGRMARILWRNWTRPARPGATPRLLQVRDLVWFRVAREDCLAVETHWDLDLPTYRRDRAAFRALLTQGLAEAWRLWRAPGLRDAWRAAAPRLTSVAFWRGYVRRT